MDRRILPITVALLAVFAGCVGALQPVAPAQAQAGAAASEGPVVTVSADGTASAAPDLAVVRLAVERRADDADRARELVGDDVADVREALGDLDLPDDAVTTTGFSLFPRYDYSDGERELIGYVAIHTLRVEAGVGQAGEVVDAAVGAGATRVSGVQFTLRPETRDDLRAEALAAAMASARADADAVADAAGLSVTGVRSISTSDVPSPFPGPVFAEAGDARGATSFEPGDVTVRATVSVEYEAGADGN